MPIREFWIALDAMVYVHKVWGSILWLQARKRRQFQLLAPLGNDHKRTVLRLSLGWEIAKILIIQQQDVKGFDIVDDMHFTRIRFFAVFRTDAGYAAH